MHCSPFGVIPKKHKPGKWRLIIDLSAPEGSSVNDGIAKELCSLAYTSVDEVVVCILKREGVATSKNGFKVAGNPAFSRSTNLESKLIEFFVFVNKRSFSRVL